MLRLEDIKKGVALLGIEPGQAVQIISTDPVGEALTVYYKTKDGQLKEQMLFRSNEPSLSLAEETRSWAFDAPGEEFKLAVEAYRISLAHLFDPMMAVHTSNVEPLPHQITAVYESMLPRQPLRYVLADDPGAGKTIMAGLLIRELLMRADAERILIVAPGGLVEQWQDEMYEKFGLSFTILSREIVENSLKGNLFDDYPLLIARLDQLSRNVDLQEKLKQTYWDLVVVDEAHKMSATYYGKKINKTLRFKLGELLREQTRHFLLMTATPHNGKEEDFQLFLSLLDPDRFLGRFRDGALKVDVSDIMRRMVKEELLKFDSTPLFPERIAESATYELSEAEAALYHDVTQYVREEMNKADRIENNQRRGTIGFALTGLQRRLASSPEAIFQSLKRRRERLKGRVDEVKISSGERVNSTFSEPIMDDPWDADEELTSEEYEQFEEKVVDRATASATIQELESEIHILEGLEEQARRLVQSKMDRKWDELSRLLQETPEMKEGGRQRKLIVFTEYKDTLRYLASQIRSLLGSYEAVVTIDGGDRREERRKKQEMFRNDPGVRILVATDAAGEGVNLQNAHLMVNYDLPWNPNRLEQRFGRIHRIGQTEVCRLWNLVAAETREGDVFQRLLQKLETERQALGGRVFDILGEVFNERSLKDLLIEAIRYGDDPEVRARLLRKVEGALDTDHLQEIMRQNALCEEVMDAERLFAIKSEMEKAEARKLQPYFIQSFFSRAFEEFAGSLRPREKGRWEIRHVPASIREHSRRISYGRQQLLPVVDRYERVCFEKEYVRLMDPPGAPMAELIHPGHPLMEAVTDLVLEAHGLKMRRGAILLDPNDLGTVPKLLFIIDHSVRDGNDENRTVSRRMQFLTIDPEGMAENAGYAPHLDLQPIDENEMDIVDDVLTSSWINNDLEHLALSYATERIVPEHYNEVKGQREHMADRTLEAVQARLVKEINYQSGRYLKLQAQMQAGKDVRLNLENTRRTVDDLTARLNRRQQELKAERHIISATPVIAGGALIIPAGLLAQRRGEETVVDAAARKHVEMVAMEAVLAAERALGNEAVDVSAEKCGWDITSWTEGQETRHIEVKGRAKGQTSITVSRNEILYGLNQADKFILAIVLADGETYEGPFYIRMPFDHEPGWAVTSVNFDLQELLGRAERP
jgi:SNF2 family DNA or RNA helicase